MLWHCQYFEGIVVAANPGYYRLYGYTPEEVIGHSYAIIFPEEEREVAMRNYKETFTEGNAVYLLKGQ